MKKVTRDLKTGYSPERINQGDRVHTLDKAAEADKKEASQMGYLYWRL